MTDKPTIIEQDFYLTLSPKSVPSYNYGKQRDAIPNKGLSGKLTVGKARLNKDEIAVKLKVRIPASVFEKPNVSTTLEIKEGQIIEPELEVEVDDQPEG